MSREEWQQAYQEAWGRYYTDEHVERMLRRGWPHLIRHSKLVNYAAGQQASIRFEGILALESGIVRRKRRKDRRPGMPIENPLIFYPAYWRHVVRSFLGFSRLWLRYNRMEKRIRAQPDRMEYMDRALAPVTLEEREEMELYDPTPLAERVASGSERLVQLGGDTGGEVANVG